jgi:hypothetical protein
MKLTNDIYHRSVTVSREYAMLKDIFEKFTRETLSLEHDGRLKAVTIKANLAQDELLFTFAGARIRFKMLPGYNAATQLVGNILVTRDSHRLSDDVELLDTFMIDTQGMTEIQNAEKAELAYLPHFAGDIVLHYLHEAIAKPVQ